MQSASLFLRPIRAGDNLSGFSLGAKDLLPLKTFLRRDAVKYHENNVAKTFVLVDSPEDSRVFGYLSLLCSEIKNKDQTHLDDCETANRYNSFPAIKLARLAIHRDLQGQGYGSGMVDWCIRHIVENIMPHVGCRFLVADAKHHALSFYEKTGFSLMAETVGGNRPVVFVDLNKLG